MARMAHSAVQSRVHALTHKCTCKNLRARARVHTNTSIFTYRFTDRDEHKKSFQRLAHHALNIAKSDVHADTDRYDHNHVLPICSLFPVVRFSNFFAKTDLFLFNARHYVLPVTFFQFRNFFRPCIGTLLVHSEHLPVSHVDAHSVSIGVCPCTKVSPRYRLILCFSFAFATFARSAHTRAYFQW